MKKKRFSVEQIVRVLKQAELGVPVTEVIRKAGISEQTFYRWKAKYAGLEVDQVRQMAQLQEENLRLKKLVAELVLDKAMLQDVLSKMVKPSRRGPMVDRLMSSYGASERRACRVLCVTRGRDRYRSCCDSRTELRMRIREIAQERVRYGYRKIRVLLNREGWYVGKHLMYRLYKEEGLMLKRMKPGGRRSKSARQREEKLKPVAPDQAWSMDFVADQLQDGARFRSLTN
jgi:putative transposase